MQAGNFDLNTYFSRIGFGGPARADAPTLAALMRHQLFSVPFENLDVQAGKGVSLVPEDIVDKIVHQKRGGYCYEINGLFAMALSALQIPYRFVAARPMFYPVRRPRTHMALVVRLDGADWLCDLGFGSYGIRAPLRLDSVGTPVEQDFDRFLLTQPQPGEYLLQAWVDGAWANQYGFDLSPQEWIDFMPANYLNSTHPDAVFVQKMLVVQQHPEGRDILFGDTLKQVTAAGVQVQTVAPPDRAAVLSGHFGLRWPLAAADAA